MPMQIENRIGKIVFSDETLKFLAGLTATECYGIVGMASVSTSNGLAELLKRENMGKGVKLFIRDNKLTIDLYVVVEYGLAISTVAENIIETVKYRIQHSTGLIVDAVNINVQGIRV